MVKMNTKIKIKVYQNNIQMNNKRKIEYNKYNK